MIEEITLDDSNTYHGIENVDAPSEVNAAVFSGNVDLITLGLLHRADWIACLAANLAEKILNKDTAEPVVRRVIWESEGIATAAAAQLAREFLGDDRALEILIERLKAPLNSGSQHLFPYLAEVWNRRSDGELEAIARGALRYGPRTAIAALQAIKDCGHEPVSFIPLLQSTYAYWLENEEPYPQAGGAVPESPRALALRLMIDANAVADKDLLEALSDTRSDVVEVVRSTLLIRTKSTEVTRREVINQIKLGKAPETLVSELLRAKISWRPEEVEVILGLLTSPSANLRWAAASILDLAYMSKEEIRRHAQPLLHDPVQRVRDRALERFEAMRDSERPG